MNIKILWVLVAAFALTACQTLTPAKVIETERNNITTTDTVSIATNRILVSAGFDLAGCMANFYGCIASVSDVYLDADRHELATLAELYYAYAKTRKNRAECAIERAPINPYYLNAPLSASEQAPAQTTKRTHSIPHK